MRFTPAKKNSAHGARSTLRHHHNKNKYHNKPLGGLPITCPPEFEAMLPDVYLLLQQAVSNQPYSHAPPVTILWGR